jgi:large subunit ribosomal protein L4
MPAAARPFTIPSSPCRQRAAAAPPASRPRPPLTAPAPSPGARKAPAAHAVWVGGGVVFGPHPRDYSKSVPKAVRKLALRKALSARIAAGDVLVVDGFSVAEPKTKQFVSLVASAVSEVKVLVIAAAFDENTYKAARNVKPTQLVTAREVNTEQLLAYRKIIVTNDALPQLAERTSK